MQIDPIQLNIRHTLLNDYYEQTNFIQSYFQYNPFADTTYQERLAEVQSRSYPRCQLTEILDKMNRKWNAPETTMANIERLNQPDSTVVIAGQQAGLLTGPLYSLNKVISVIQFAKDQEQKRQAPVIPVFWIAGEDHDFAEINHVFMPEGKRMKKMATSQYTAEGTPVSEIEISHRDTQQWLDELFEHMPETVYTKGLYGHLHRCLKTSNSYVDFFAQIIHALFPDTGLVLLDSGNADLRRLESPFFAELIKKQPEIAEQVHQTVEQLKQKGYNLSLDTAIQDGHLFYHADGGRYLLSREEATGDWISKQENIRLTTADLLQIAEQAPKRLSNNVVTRPLMQEWLFPTLAFLGGPGEITYWSALKPAFAACGLVMPPVVPRRSFTLIDRDVERSLKKHHITAKTAIEHGANEQKLSWLAAQQEPPITEVVEEIKRAIDNVHSPLRQIAADIRPDIGSLAHTNLDHINRELDLLERRMTKAVKQTYAHEIDEFDLIEQSLHPRGELQERVWNPLPFFNQYSTDFVEKLAAVPWLKDRSHIIVYL